MLKSRPTSGRLKVRQLVDTAHILVRVTGLCRNAWPHLYGVDSCVISTPDVAETGEFMVSRRRLALEC